MSGWKMVPVEPTEEMKNAGDEVSKWTPSALIHAAMLSATPDPTTDEALVERVARAIYPHMFAHSDYNEVPFAEAMSRPRYAFLKERVLHAALAAIRAMEEKP